MLTSTASIRLIDFGLSKFLAQKTNLSEIAGTIDYMAPEVLDGYYNQKADIWSLGVALFIMISGHYPFSVEGSSVKEKSLNIRRAHYRLGKSFDNVSDQCKNFIKALFVVDPKERPTAA